MLDADQVKYIVFYHLHGRGFYNKSNYMIVSILLTYNNRMRYNNIVISNCRSSFYSVIYDLIASMN